MLKKAGIIVAAAATGVLAVSGLAFASESNGNLKNDCAFGNATGNARQAEFGGTSLLGGVASTLASTVTQTAEQTNTGNCTNVNTSDLIDDGSNNRTETKTDNMVKGSFNTED